MNDQRPRDSIPSVNSPANGEDTVERFQIRDRRGGGWFWVHNDAIRRAGPHIGPIGIAVYNVLAMHASESDQTCFPSLGGMARLLGISRDKVRHAIEKLKRLHMIEIERPEDPARTHEHNVYVLTAPELWELPEENDHAQSPAQRKSTFQKKKTAAKGGLCAQPKTGASKTRLGSETQSAHSLCVSDSNEKNGDSGSVADMPKMQIGTARTDLCGIENAQGNGENEGSNFGDSPTNKNYQTRLIDKTHHHDDGDAIRSLTKLGISDPRELLARALREGWTPSELADVAERLRQVPPEKVANPAGLLVRLIREGYRAASEAVERYLPDQPQGEKGEDKRARIIREYESCLRLYLCRGLPESDRMEARERGLELRAQLEQMGVDPDAIKARVLEGLWGDTRQSLMAIGLQ